MGAMTTAGCNPGVCWSSGDCGLMACSWSAWSSPCETSLWTNKTARYTDEHSYVSTNFRACRCHSANSGEAPGLKSRDYRNGVSVLLMLRSPSEQPDQPHEKRLLFGNTLPNPNLALDLQTAQSALLPAQQPAPTLHVSCRCRRHHRLVCRMSHTFLLPQ